MICGHLFQSWSWEGEREGSCEGDTSRVMVHLCEPIALMCACCHVLGTCREHMLSWSPRADIEDEERQYFKANVFPEVRLPQPIQLWVLTSLPWTTKRTHKRKGRLTKCYQLRFPRLWTEWDTCLPKIGSFHQISLEETHNHTLLYTHLQLCS